MRKRAWFVAIDQVKVGPFLSETIRALLKLKRLLPTDLAWSEEMKGWAPISECRDLLPVDPASSSPPSSGESATRQFQRTVRRFRRAPIQGKIVTEEGKAFPMVNISEGGLLLAATDLPAVASALVFQLHSVSLGEPFKVCGWITRHAIAPPFLGFGVEFSEIAPRDRERIRLYIETQLLAADGTPSSQPG